MSGFSDEDLQRLEKRNDEPRWGIMLPQSQMKALLSRLEAAEKVCYVLSNTKSIRAASAWDRLQEWEDSKGGAGK